MPHAFTKPALSISEQIELLLSRGLIIVDREQAKHALTYIGYYRLSGYMLPFQHQMLEPPLHQFKQGTTFEDILNLYSFDRKLRLLVMDAIERIEVAVRSVMTNHLSTLYGPHWFMNKDLFQPGFNHTLLLDTLKKDLKHDSMSLTQALPIKHYYKKYNHPEFPPSWMVFESVSFGMVSTTYAYLHMKEQKEIASAFSLHSSLLKSWLQSIAYLRNLCAHHARLWNRIYTIKPKVSTKYKNDMTPNGRFYAQACIIHIFLKKILQNSEWLTQLKHLFADYSTIDQERMGFPAQWEDKDFWKEADPLT